jgi:DNA (cytosine-5)-methyltransferase 1
MSIACVDLFCGAGGLTHGFVKEGLRVTAGIDLDSACRFPYESNNDSVFHERDVSTVSFEELNHMYGDATIKVLAGCAPCQPFSNYSNRYDINRNNRWSLLNEFSRLIGGVRPDVITMENVPSVRKHEVFNDFVVHLKEFGYQVWYQVVDSTHYGIPQTRKRLVLLASLHGSIEMIERTHLKPKTVRQAIGRLAPISAGEFSKRDRLHTAAALNEINLKRIRCSKPGGTWRDWPEELVAECHKDKRGKTFGSVYGRMEWNKPAPTMTTQCFGYGNGRFGHPELDRAISLREAAIIQTFPRNYRFLKRGEEVNVTALGRMIGNAVPVALGQAIAKSIKNHLREVELLV